MVNPIEIPSKSHMKSHAKFHHGRDTPRPPSWRAGGLARAAFSHPPGLFERLRVGSGSGKPRIKACSTQWGPILNMASRSRCVLHVDPACFIYGWKSSPLVTDDFPIKIPSMFDSGIFHISGGAIKIHCISHEIYSGFFPLISNWFSLMDRISQSKTKALPSWSPASHLLASPSAIRVLDGRCELRGFAIVGCKKPKLVIILMVT